MASTSSETLHHHRQPAEQRRHRQLTIGAAVVGGLTLLLWPLQTILAAILVGSSWIITMALGVWIERSVEARDRDEILRRLPQVAGGLVALAIVLTFVWPMTMAAVTLLLAIAAAGGMAFLAWVERQLKTEQRQREWTDSELEALERQRRAA